MRTAIALTLPCCRSRSSCRAGSWSDTIGGNPLRAKADTSRTRRCWDVNVTASTRTASAKAPPVQCRQSIVNVRGRDLAPAIRIMSNVASPTLENGLPPSTGRTMPPLPQALSRILSQDATFATWDARRRREEALTRLIRGHLPRALAARVQVAETGGSELELVADAGAIAAIV